MAGASVLDLSPTNSNSGIPVQTGNQNKHDLLAAESNVTSGELRSEPEVKQSILKGSATRTAEGDVVQLQLHLSTADLHHAYWSSFLNGLFQCLTIIFMIVSLVFQILSWQAQLQQNESAQYNPKFTKAGNTANILKRGLFQDQTNDLRAQGSHLVHLMMAYGSRMIKDSARVFIEMIFIFVIRRSGRSYSRLTQITTWCAEIYIAPYFSCFQNHYSRSWLYMGIATKFLLLLVRQSNISEQRYYQLLKIVKCFGSAVLACFILTAAVRSTVFLRRVQYSLGQPYDTGKAVENEKELLNQWEIWISFLPALLAILGDWLGDRLAPLRRKSRWLSMVAKFCGLDESRADYPDDI